MRFPSVFIALLVLAVAPLAQAGVTTFTGPVAKGEKVVYIFTGGQINDTPPGDVAVVVSCINLSSAVSNVRVEFFGDSDGKFLGGVDMTMPPGDTDHAVTDRVAVLESQHLASLSDTLTSGVAGRVVLIGKGAVFCNSHLYVNHTTTTPSVAALPGLSVPKPPRYKPSKK